MSVLNGPRDGYEVLQDVGLPTQAYILKPGSHDSDRYLSVSGHLVFELEFAKDLCAALNMGRSERHNHEK